MYDQLSPAPNADTTTTVRFPKQPAYKDVGWAALFIVNLLAIAVLAMMNLREDKDAAKDAAHAADDLSHDMVAFWNTQEGKTTLSLCVGSIFLGGVWSFLWVSIMKAFAKQLIYFTIWLNIATQFAMALWFFSQGNTYPAFMFVFTGCIVLFWFYMVRSRIAFSTVLLSTVSELVKKFPATVMAAMLSMLPQVVWLFLWMFAVKYVVSHMQYSTTVEDEYGDDEVEVNRTFGGVMFLLLVSLFWVAAVIKNVVHVTIAGTFASWYFQAGAQMPANPTWGAFKRAVSTSFGSICLGSLMVAVIKALRTMAQSARRNNQNAILAACCQCFLGCLEWLVTFFNTYAYARVAIYGDSFMKAAKDTWTMFQSVGMEAVIQQDLINGVLSFGVLVGGLANGFVMGMIAKSTIVDSHGNPYMLAGTFPVWALVAIFAVFFGFAMMMPIVEVVHSGVATLYVCYAEEPATLQYTHPELFAKFHSVLQNHQSRMPATAQHLAPNSAHLHQQA